ncbi:MAG: hypothetical protein IKR81_15510 [Victivallales bacterium]|nr:hypothetical protein [Victivallales bacterium]
MKHLFFIVLVAFCGIIAGAENTDFRLEASLGKTVFQPGEIVAATVQPIHPDTYRPLYYRAITDGKKLPPGFGEKIGALVDKYGMVFIDRGPLKHPTLKGYFTYPRLKTPDEKPVLSFSTENWPCGDYTVRIQLMHIHKDPAVKDPKKKYPYSYATLHFSIEEPHEKLDTTKAFVNLPWQGGFIELAEEKPAAVQTRFKQFYRNGAFYFLIEAQEPEMPKVQMDKMPADSGDIWRNDSIEIAISAEPGAQNIYKYIFDAAGQFCDLKATDDNTNQNRYNFFSEWDSMTDFQVERQQNAWLINAKIPVAAMVSKQTTPDSFRFNVVRHRRVGGKLVTSSFADLKGVSLHQPLKYIKLAAEGFKAEEYNVTLDKLETNYRSSGQLDMEAVLRSDHATAKMVLIRFSLDNGKEHYETSLVEPLEEKTGRRVAARLVGMKDGEYKLSWQVMTNSTEPVLLATGSRKVELLYNPLALEVSNPPYRDCIFATMPDKTLRFSVVSQFEKALELVAMLQGEGKKLEQSFTAQTGKTELTFDMAPLPEGSYTLRITDGAKLVRERRIRKLPYRKGEVWLDASGVTYIDGVKTMPFGWIGNQPYQPDASLNAILLYIRVADCDHARKIIADNFKKGQRTLIYFTQEATGTAWSEPRLFAENERRSGLNEAQKDQIIKFVGEIGKEEGLLAWYMADEPEGRNNNPLFYEESLDVIKEVDPYHPGVMLNYGLDGIRRFYKGGDILAPDCYPMYFEDGSTGKARTVSSEWARTASSLRPSWLVPQMALWPYISADGKLRGVAPDYRDQRMQFLQASIHNCKGFLMYTFYTGQVYSDLIIGHVELGRTLQMLKDYLLGNTLPEAVAVKPEMPGVIVGLKQFNGQYCLIAVNTDQEPRAVDFHLSPIKDTTLYEAGGNGVFSVKNGRFQETLAAKESKFYLTDKALAAQVPSVEDVERRVAELKNSRLKEGNLIGTGELYEADYRNFFKGNIPPGVTIIKASSESINYTTRNTGTLYYLLDGLTEPTWPDFAWTPMANDKTPWLEFTLPAEKKMNCLKLYSPGATLSTGRVMVNGKVFPFDGVGRKTIEVKLDGSLSKSIKIEFDRDGAKPEDGIFSKRFLTEVELY